MHTYPHNVLPNKSWMADDKSQVQWSRFGRSHRQTSQEMGVGEEQEKAKYGCPVKRARSSPFSGSHRGRWGCCLGLNWIINKNILKQNFNLSSFPTYPFLCAKSNHCWSSLLANLLYKSSAA
ncbi:hypothetical protein NPIL_241001 [Nephila pilipes]|uniref:Uncharacterized protein n=1 Tax=Nephila pilipes TaxID=299642 RepID=A0A8X6US27_NEPPI|nr:hypothetical protein NPIL_241001 [Nephila pilipes]